MNDWGSLLKLSIIRWPNCGRIDEELPSEATTMASPGFISGFELLSAILASFVIKYSVKICDSMF